MLNLTKRTFCQNVKLNALFKKKKKEVCRHKSLKSHFYGRKIEFPQIVSTNWVSANSFYLESLKFASIIMYSSKCYFIFAEMATFSRFGCYVKLGSAGGIWWLWTVLKHPLSYWKDIAFISEWVTQTCRSTSAVLLWSRKREAKDKIKPPQLFTSGYGSSVVKICRIDYTCKESCYRQF